MPKKRKVHTKFVNEYGHPIDLKVRQFVTKPEVNIRMAGHGSVGHWVITNKEAAKLRAALVALGH
jgi:hypothetical protein